MNPPQEPEVPEEPETPVDPEPTSTETVEPTDSEQTPPTSEPETETGSTEHTPQPVPGEHLPNHEHTDEVTQTEEPVEEESKWKFWSSWEFPTLTMTTVWVTLEIAGTILFIVFVAAISLYCVQRCTDPKPEHLDSEADYTASNNYSQIEEEDPRERRQSGKSKMKKKR